MSELQEGNLKHDIWQRTTKPQMYCQRTEWDLQREGFSGELRHTSVGSITGIFDPGLAATGWSVFFLAILLSPPWLQIWNSSSWQFPAVVFSHLTSWAARSTLCVRTQSQETRGPILCPLDAHTRIAATVRCAPAAQVCCQISAGEPCTGFPSHEPGHGHIHSRVGVLYPRWQPDGCNWTHSPWPHVGLTVFCHNYFPSVFGVLNLCFVDRFPKGVYKKCQENVSSRMSQYHQSASALGIKMEVSVVPSSY